MRVDFIHIGYQKTASTFLQARVFPRIKGLAILNHLDLNIDKWFFDRFVNIDAHSFDREYFLNCFERKIETHHSQWKQTKILAISEENLCGHIYTGMESKDLLQRLHEVFGDARILICIRNQVDFLLSTYSNYVLHGGVKSFPQWLAGQETSHGRIIEKIKYKALVQDYMSVFGPENVTVIQYEKLFDKGEGGITQFLSLFDLTLPLLERKRMNPGTSLKGNMLITNLNKLGFYRLHGRQRLFGALRRPSSDRVYVCNTLANHMGKIRKNNEELENIIGQKLADEYFV